MGVVQDIELVVSKAAASKAVADAAAAGTEIGNAIGNSPAVQRAAQRLGAVIGEALNPDKALVRAQQYVKVLERQFEFSAARTKAALAKGMISPAEAAEQGRKAAQSFNAGILSQVEKLTSAGTFRGSQGREIFVDLTGKLKSVGQEGARASQGIGAMKGALFSLAAQAANVPGPVGSLTNAILSLSASSGVVIGVAAGIGIIVRAYQQITAGARAAREEHDKLLESFRQGLQDDVTGPAAERAAAERELMTARQNLRLARAGTPMLVRGEVVGTRVDEAAVERAETRVRQLQIQLQQFDAKRTASNRDEEIAALAQLRSAGELTSADRARVAELVKQLEAERSLASTSAARARITEQILSLTKKIGTAIKAAPSLAPVDLSGLKLPRLTLAPSSPLGDHSIEERIQIFGQGLQSVDTFRQSVLGLKQAEFDLAKQMATTNTNTEAYFTLASQLVQVQRLLGLGTKEASDQFKALAANTEKLRPIPGQRLNTFADENDRANLQLGVDTSLETPKPDPEAKDEWRELYEEVGEFAFNASEQISDSFSETFELLFSGAQTLKQTLVDLPKGLAAGLAKEIAIEAKLEGRKAIARSIHETAEGIAALIFHPEQATQHFLAAGKFLAEATAWSALGGAAGAAAGAIAPGGAGGAGASDRARTDDRDPLAEGRKTATLIINGGDILDTNNRKQMDQLAKALSLVSDYNVVIKRGAA